VPETFVIGKDGKIAYKHVGPLTPDTAQTLLLPAIEKALAAPDVKAKLAALGVDPVGGTTAAFTKYVKDDVDRWAKIIKAANIKIE